MFFSSNLEYLIKKNNYSLGNFANEIGINKGNLSKYVNKITIPKIDTAVQIAKFFDVSLDQLVLEDLTK